MKEVKTLCKTDWVSLKKIIDKENDVNGYDYLHEDRYNGKIVSILPYRIINEKIEYLLRNEITPCWNGNNLVISSITGGVENDNPRQTAILEMAEEAGYEIKKEDLILIDKCYGTKSSDTVYFIYAVDLTNKEKTLSADGDGSELEKKAHCFWSNNIDLAEDPLVFVGHYNIQKKLLK